MTNYDIERIEKFMDLFELSMNDIFNMLGIGVCHLGIRAAECANYEDMNLYTSAWMIIL